MHKCLQTLVLRALIPADPTSGPGTPLTTTKAYVPMPTPLGHLILREIYCREPHKGQAMNRYNKKVLRVSPLRTMLYSTIYILCT